MRSKITRFSIVAAMNAVLIIASQTALAGAREESYKKHREMILVLKKWDVSSSRVSLGLKSSRDRAYLNNLTKSKAFQKAKILPFLDLLVIREGRRKITLKKVQSRPLKVAINNRIVGPIDPKNILQSLQRSNHSRSAWHELILPSADAETVTPGTNPDEKWLFLYALLSNYDCRDCGTPEFKAQFMNDVPMVLEALQIKKMTCGKDETRIALHNDADFTYVCRYDRCSIPNAEGIVDDVIDSKKGLSKSIIADLNDLGVPITNGLNIDRITEGIYYIESEVLGKLSPTQQDIVKNYRLPDSDELYVLRVMTSNSEMAKTVTTTLEPFGAVIHSFNACCKEEACRKELSGKSAIEIIDGDVER